MPNCPVTRIAAVAAVLCLGVAGASAQTTEPSAEPEPAGETAGETGAAITAETVVATVDEATITLGEIIAIRQTLPDEYQSMPAEMLMEALVKQMINQQVLANAAHAAGLRDLPSVRLALRNQERSVLADAYMAQQIVERVNEETVDAYYQANYVDIEPVEEVRVAHILVSSQDTAAALKTRLDGGADFSALASKNGIDDTASRGGDLGWLTRDRMIPPLADAVFAMTPGTISDPVETPYGWHVIKLEERRNRPVPPREAVEGEIVRTLTAKASEDILDEARTAAKITRPLSDVNTEQINDDALIEQQDKP